MVRRQIETPEGLREKVTDITAQAHHWLDSLVVIQADTRLSAIFELLKANDALKAIYTRHWVHDYVARYEAIRSGEVVPAPRENADPQEPALEALVVSLHQEVRLPNGLLETITTALDPKTQAATGYLNLVDGTDAPLAADGSRPYIVKESSSYWHVSGRSVPFTQDTERWGRQYKAGSHISYSVSASFDRCIALPLCIGAGVMTLEIRGMRRKDRLTVSVPLGSDQEPPPITLHELIGAITYDFSFHGGPQETQVAMDELRQSCRELDDERHAEDLRFGMAHTFCPDNGFHHREAHARELQDRTRYWDLAQVMAHTGWTEAEIKTRCSQGRLMELSAYATNTTPHRDVYPAAQFASGFDVELFRFLNWVASQSCSDWATQGFLSEWTTRDQAGEMINGWSVLALPDVALDYEEITDPVLKGYGNSRAPLRQVFAPDSPKTALVCAFETFAEQRRLDYERRDELEDEE
ncbi:MAG: hypothetical protein Q8M20_11310 [Rhodocyclaceae bacterium]|nr:hypothetical protein [Rhodocyclaceae bacterium]MDZ4216315.1 hypothetical protein [Rhodocyclaceae bacterium]